MSHATGTQAIELIVADQLLIRLGLKQVLSHQFRDVVFGEAQTAAEALAQIQAQPWHLVILDVSLPDNDDASSVLREVRVRRPQAAVLVLGMHSNSQYAARSLQLGASGYVSKSSGRSDLLKAVSNVLDGKKYFSAELSAQEYKVLRSLAAGKRTSEVAAELNLSAKTVSTYKRRVLNKLGIGSTADLVRYVIDNHLS
jgi:two-component system, NarL family, invasion response regulator UvrY